MDVYDALKFRRSAKQFGATAPDRATLERILADWFEAYFPVAAPWELTS